MTGISAHWLSSVRTAQRISSMGSGFPYMTNSSAKCSNATHWAVKRFRKAAINWLKAVKLSASPRGNPPVGESVGNAGGDCEVVVPCVDAADEEDDDEGVEDGVGKDGRSEEAKELEVEADGPDATPSLRPSP